MTFKVKRLNTEIAETADLNVARSVIAGTDKVIQYGADEIERFEINHTPGEIPRRELDGLPGQRRHFHPGAKRKEERLNRRARQLKRIREKESGIVS